MLLPVLARGESSQRQGNVRDSNVLELRTPSCRKLRPEAESYLIPARDRDLPQIMNYHRLEPDRGSIVLETRTHNSRMLPVAGNYQKPLPTLGSARGYDLPEAGTSEGRHLSEAKSCLPELARSGGPRDRNLLEARTYQRLGANKDWKLSETECLRRSRGPRAPTSRHHPCQRPKSVNDQGLSETDATRGQDLTETGSSNSSYATRD
ncbi:hypothetical protein J6590_022902 [Homalodisca vitripennis]|nr:hypothetical protein J6590_022902 [Homalodisca vitripennis]